MSTGNPTLDAAIANSYQKTDPTRFCYAVSPLWRFDNKNHTDVRINYVIATWSGARRAGNSSLLTDATCYLKKHIDQLNDLQHKLSQITVVAPYNPKESENFTNFLGSLDNLASGSSKIRLLRRTNEGQSYGSYVDCFLNCRNQFDYYIFVEDDYIPAQHNFDDILVQMFKASKNCGYLCSRVDKYPPTNYMGRPHAAISNGITSSKVLEDILQKLGEIPCGRRSTLQHIYAATPQLEFSWAFLDAGYWLYDYSNHYNAPYHHVGKIQHYGSLQKPSLFVPIQSL